MDIMDASTGRLLTQLVDTNLSTICPVNKPHPRLDVIISGSSRSLYAWRPVNKGAAAIHILPKFTEHCPQLKRLIINPRLKALGTGLVISYIGCLMPHG